MPGRTISRANWSRIEKVCFGADELGAETCMDVDGICAASAAPDVRPAPTTAAVRTPKSFFTVFLRAHSVCEYMGPTIDRCRSTRRGSGERRPDTQHAGPRPRVIAAVRCTALTAGLAYYAGSRNALFDPVWQTVRLMNRTAYLHSSDVPTTNLVGWVSSAPNRA